MKPRRRVENYMLQSNYAIYEDHGAAELERLNAEYRVQRRIAAITLVASALVCLVHYLLH